jgi:hypothetical protein
MSPIKSLSSIDKTQQLKEQIPLLDKIQQLEEQNPTVGSELSIFTCPIGQNQPDPFFAGPKSTFEASLSMSEKSCLPEKNLDIENLLEIVDTYYSELKD